MRLFVAGVVAAFGICGIDLRAAAEVVELQVVDPQGAAIVGARVTAQCSAAAANSKIGIHELRTDDAGRLVLRASDDCVLTVEAPGFALWQGLLGDVRRTGRIPLSIAPVAQKIDVHASDRSLWMPLGSTRLGRDELAHMSWDPSAALNYAKARAGTTLREDHIYVDGLPAGVIPPSTAIEELSVNADPFSVLYSESDQNVVEIVSATPDRRFRWSSGLVPAIIGGRNPLASFMKLDRRLLDVSLAGPVPRTPLTFSFDMNQSGFREERPLMSSPDEPPQTGLSGGSGYNLAAGVVGKWTESLRTRLAVSSGRGEAHSVDLGGFVRPEAAHGHTLAADEIRFTLEATGARFRYRTGLIYGVSDSTFRAQSTGVGVLVLETEKSGGAPFEAMRFERRNWLWNTTLSPANSSWLIGWGVASERNDESLEPNPNGQWLFGTPLDYHAALDGEGPGTLMRVTGPRQQTLRSTTSAVFGQREWRLLRTVVMRAGTRLEYQAGDGVAVSPRLSARAAAGPLTWQSGIGVFRQSWSPDTMMQAQRFGRTGAEWQIADAWIDRPSDPAQVSRIRTEIDHDFTRPRSLVVSNGLEGRRSRLRYGVEHRLTSGVSRPGSRRLAADEGWLDRLESSRRLRRHQLHTRVEYSFARVVLLGHYEWVLAHDDGDGAFIFPEQQNDTAREWARSAGVSPHNVSVVVTPPLIRGVSSGVIFIARSRSPLNIRTGADVDGTRLYADRGGLPRNAGHAPGYQSLDAYAERRIRLPGVKIRGGSIFVNAMLTAENLLGVSNYSAVGSTLASPFLDRPVSALPGRTVRVSFRLGR